MTRKNSEYVERFLKTHLYKYENHVLSHDKMASLLLPKKYTSRDVLKSKKLRVRWQRFSEEEKWLSPYNVDSQCIQIQSIERTNGLW